MTIKIALSISVTFLCAACQINEKSYNSIEKKVVACEENARKFVYSFPDSALVYANEGIKLIHSNAAFSERHPKLLPLLQIKSDAFNQLELLDSSQNLIVLTENLYSIHRDSAGYAWMAYMKGNYYHHQFNWEEALLNFNNADSYFNQIPYPTGASHFFYNAAAAHLENGEISTAQGYLLKALDLYSSDADSMNRHAVIARLTHLESKGQSSLKRGKTTPLLPPLNTSVPAKTYTFNTWMDLAAAYENSFPDSTGIFLKKGIASIPAPNNTTSLILAKIKLANHLVKTGQQQKASLLFQEAIQSAQNKNHYLFGLANAGIGALALERKNYAEAMTYLSLAKTALQKSGNLPAEIQVLKYLRQLYLNLKKTDQVLETAMTIDSMQAKLAQNNFKVMLGIMSKAAQLEKTEFEQKILEGQVKTNKAIIRLRWWITAIIIFTGIIVFITGSKLWRSSREKNQAMRVLLEKYKQQLSVQQSQQNIATEAIQDLALRNKIQVLFEDKHVFLDSSLKIDDLIEQLQISHGQLSQFLKEHYNCNFPHFVNSYRVNYAKKLLINPAYHNYTVDAIGKLAGFRSRQNFYKVFQQITGVSPGTFKEGFESENP